MRIVAIDSETHLIKPGVGAPRLVCVSWAEGDKQGLLDRVGGLAFVSDLLADSQVKIVGHNIVYDLGVFCAEDPTLIPIVFAAYNAERIECTLVRQKLIDIALGELEFRANKLGNNKRSAYSLAALSEHWLGAALQKEDTYRTRYHELDGVPLTMWPAEAREYALKDARVTLDVWREQQTWCRREFENSTGSNDGLLPNLAPQCRAAWALHLMSLWGIRTDPERTATLKKQLQEEHDNALRLLTPCGIFRPDGTKDVKRVREMVEAAYLRKVNGDRNALEGILPKTPTGAIKIDNNVLIESGDENLLALARSGESAKLLSTYIPILERGTQAPIVSRPNVLVATGRTSWSDPNLQNPPRRGGVRECFLPRPGNVFIFCDYDTLELRTLAQVCLDLFGASQLAEALREGKDLHAALGAQFLGISYQDMKARLSSGDSAAEKARQEAKGFNFGRPGGMGAKKMVQYLKAQGTVLDPDYWKAVTKAEHYIEQWHEAWPEMRDYFKYISEITGKAGVGFVVQPRSGRVRGGIGYTDCANSLFQGLAADGAKEALWRVSEACYCIAHSLLYGARPVLFLHDEACIEVEEGRAANAALELQRLMVEAMRSWIPDVPVTCTPVMTRRWYKGAKPVYLKGNLVPCKPEHRTENGKLRTVWLHDDSV